MTHFVKRVGTVTLDHVAVCGKRHVETTADPGRVDCPDCGSRANLPGDWRTDEQKRNDMAGALWRMWTK